MSNTEDNLPPYFEGIPPLNNLTSFITSGLKTEKNPNTCEELKTIASSKRMRFWSAAPPLTLNPEAPSPAEVTPGSKMIDLIMSDSPKTTGICLIVLEVSVLILIWVLLIFIFSISVLISTSSKVCDSSVK